MTKIILIGACIQCPFCHEEDLTGNLWCQNEELLQADIEVPKHIGNFVRVKGIPSWCPLIDLDMVQN